MNAFWNPKYYDPSRRTLTKQLLFLSEKQLQNELRSLLYLAARTKRSLIVPNLLGNSEISMVQLVNASQAMWPGFRLIHLKKKHDLSLDILEPAFYWRIRRDYGRNGPVPAAQVVGVAAESSLGDIENLLSGPAFDQHPRIVLHTVAPAAAAVARAAVTGDSDWGRVLRPLSEPIVAQLRIWADHSVGSFPRPFEDIETEYSPIPSVSGRRARGAARLSNPAMGQQLQDGIRACDKIFHKIYGNRSCFDKCD